MVHNSFSDLYKQLNAPIISKMNSINFLYTVLTALCFTVKFDVDDTAKQDYFIFGGPTTVANLFREDDALQLVFQNDASFIHYRITNITSPFTFVWTGFRVDDVPMEIVKSSGTIDNYIFNGFTFISPYLEVLQEIDTQYVIEKSIVQCREINYAIFAAISFIVGLIARSDSITAKVMKIFNRLKTEEDIYVEMGTII